ncbi:hypothetical protein [uncultured Nisaea sp.]|uniref:hypothetical protein n=1 Tax=uncultured Nisaea sp. TaxID=538215 RepID=UPI0030EDF80A
MALDKGRTAELDHMVRKMGGIISVFEVRSDPVGNPRFSAFRVLMDIFHSMCERSLREQKDFIDEMVDFTEEEREEIKAAFEKIFGKPTSSL